MKRISLFLCLMLLMLAVGCLATSCRNTAPPEGTKGTTASTTGVTTDSATAPATTAAVTTTAPSASDTTSRDYEVDIEDILR